MIHTKVDAIAERRPVTVPWKLYDYAEDTDKREILKVLDRASRDEGFIAQLTYRGSQALKEYRLSIEAKAALLSGDIGWIEALVGKLDARLSTWLNCRLQQEIW
jgi:hypothetical protein